MSKRKSENTTKEVRITDRWGRSLNPWKPPCGLWAEAASHVLYVKEEGWVGGRVKDYRLAKRIHDRHPHRMQLIEAYEGVCVILAPDVTEKEVDAWLERDEMLDWAEDQRKAYKRGKLTPFQIEKLEALTGWSWESDEAPDHRKQGQCN